MEVDVKRLRVLMAEKGFNVASLARVSGLSPCAINLWLNHGVKPRIDSLGKLIKALNVSLDDIMKEE